VRGWLTGISGKGYSEEIFYNNGNGQPLYNGNISSVMWRDSTQTEVRGYKFTYDSLNRLTDSVYGEGSSLSDNSGRYSESGMCYNKNGALTRLKRYGKQNSGNFGLIDDLTMSLDGNRVLSVSDSAGSLVYDNSFDFKANGEGVYEYNGNGFLVSGSNKCTIIENDLLGNPRRTIDSYINEYTYSCSGEKVRVKSHSFGRVAKPTPFIGGGLKEYRWKENDSTIFTFNSAFNINNSELLNTWRKIPMYRDTEFCGPFILEFGVLNKFLFDGGYCTFSGGEASFHFYQCDHLGNNRSVVSESGLIEQTTEYYPFGGIYGDVSTNPGLQPYKYNGKEFDHFSGLDLYDYGARMYDPAIAVWIGVDPLCEKYYNVSPYAYCLNNPVNAVDIDGKGVWIRYNDGYGKYRLFFFNGTQKKDDIPNNTFVKTFIQTYIFLKKHHAGKNVIDGVENNNYTIVLQEGLRNIFDRGNGEKTVYWNSRLGLKTSHGGRQSPATGLEHEFSHAIDYSKDYKSHKERLKIPMGKYDKKEEYRAIQDENITARILGESIRNDHDGISYEVCSPISVKTFRDILEEMPIDYYKKGFFVNECDNMRIVKH